MIREEIVHVKGMPRKLGVFLHGYQDTAEHIERKSLEMQELDNFALHIPQAPFISEVDAAKRQWYSIHRFDPNDERRNATSWEEFVEFYNRMTVGLVEADQYILEYVDGLLNQYGLGYEDLFLFGFSQGAMCAIYSALMCPHKIAGVVSFSGILAARGYVENHYRSRPDLLLIHGKQDEKIKFASLEYTASDLRKLGCKTETFALEETGHRIMPEAVSEACRFIKERF